ncbi:MAG: RagB/SusD family nutrient uptake outer membrane protein [Bacteroidota bacterium]
MKKYIKILLISVLAISCDFLDETPEDFLSPSNFYVSSEDAVAAVNAIYNQLSFGSYYGGNMWEVGERASDNLKEGPVSPPDQESLHTFTWTSANSNFGGLWQRIYVSINRANTAIESIPNINMNEELKNRLLAESKFLRALNYFDLLRIYGSVPLTETPTEDLQNLFVERSDINQIWNLIIRDLQESENVLPASYQGNDVGRATQGAAKSLLARVYLYKGDYSLAAQKAKEVIDANQFSLFEDVADLWDVTNKNGVEHIFSVQYLGGVQGSSFSNLFAVRGAAQPITGSSSAIVRQELVDSFEENDQRKAVSILDSYTFSDGSTETFEPHVWKFFDPTAPDPTSGSTNWPIIRYAEVLLIYAEALNESNSGPNAEAYEAINAIRNRAGLENLSEGMTQAAFKEALLNERRWELCFEGHRYFDLKRNNLLRENMAVLGITVEDRHFLYPLPLRELDANPDLTQNPSYTQ